MSSLIQGTTQPAPIKFLSQLVNMKTRIVQVLKGQPGFFRQEGERLGIWEVPSDLDPSMSALHQAAAYLISNDTPVAFPTETVYGLGADATRTEAVKGIYAAKGRPSDNPLIVHICDLDMLRSLLQSPGETNGHHNPIPEVYKPLIELFWPGPLTILLPNPQPSKLAPEVTAGLSTFGARMPNSPLALSLIKLAKAPLAAPSANASTKPSPTTAQHVLDDLNGRIEIILDGGPCDVGVESTVVDGLCDPPVVLRPGGVSMEELRSCPGWENVVRGYKDGAELGKEAPRAPGMKYKHYSPKATVVLYESTSSDGKDGVSEHDLLDAMAVVKAEKGQPNGHDRMPWRRIGIVRTRRWRVAPGITPSPLVKLDAEIMMENSSGQADAAGYKVRERLLQYEDLSATVLDIDLGHDIRGIAQGLFSALRELDKMGADIIFVDGIDDKVDIAAAVMNRLRKAASEIRC
jgi:L-threonylcarbamoyladenylate synthase